MSWSWRKILQLRPIVRNFVWYKLGDGSKVSAWFDSWCSISPIAFIVSSRDIHRAGFNSNTTVRELVMSNGWAWPNEWLVRYPSFGSISVPLLVDHMEDSLCWRSNDGVLRPFSVSLVWDCIRHRDINVDWYHLVWFSHRIPKHAFHLWLVMKRRLRTQDMLRHHDAANQDPLLCPLCKMQPDSHDHLFFACSYSMQVWDTLKMFAGLTVLPSSLDSIVNVLIGSAKSRSVRSVISKLLFAAAAYVIWQERNNRLFKKQSRSEAQVVDFIKSTVRLKLLTCRFKKTANVIDLVRVWKLPTSLIHS